MKQAKSEPKNLTQPGYAVGPSPQGLVAMFGADDEYVATFIGSSVSVTRFEDLGRHLSDTPLMVADLDFEAVKIWPGGRGGAWLMYAIDTDGKLWAVDFGSGSTGRGLAEAPRCWRLAETLDGPMDDLVVLRRHLVLQQLQRGGVYDLHQLDRRTGRVTSVGSLRLEADISALDPDSHTVLLGRQQGEQRLIVVGGSAVERPLEVHSFAIPRVTAATVVDGTYLVVGRKGGFLDKVNLRTALPDAVVREADGLADTCEQLRRLLEGCSLDCSCECDCTCQGHDEEPGRPGGGIPRPDRPGGRPGGGPGDRRPLSDRPHGAPCADRHKAKLNFTASRLHRVGSHLVALDRGATRMAVLDDSLNVQFERKLDRAGADVQPGQPHTQNLLIHLARKQRVEAWGVADYVAPNTLAMGDFTTKSPMPLKPVTYWGQKHHQAEANPTVKVCLFPTIEPGQAYNDLNMNKLMGQMKAKIFPRIQDFYDENSFGEVAIDFKTFGYDFGGPRKPLVLPSPLVPYWWDTYRGGGLKAVMPADWADPVIFDGSEVLEIQANPRVGAVKIYDLPFAALWTAGNLGTFPVNIDFDGTETAELTVERQDGASHVLGVQFPAISLTVNQNDDIAAFLGTLGDYLTDAIRAAEDVLPGKPKLIQDVKLRRYRMSDVATDFGSLLGQLRCQPVPLQDVVQKGRISVTTPGPTPPALSILGWAPGAGQIGVMTSVSGVETFFKRCLWAAQVDADEGIGGNPAYFSATVSLDEDVMAQELTVGMGLEGATGGELATMEVLSSSSLANTGWDVATPDPGSESDPKISNTLRHAVDLANDTFTAAMEHLRATTVWNRSEVAALFADFDIMMIVHVGAPHASIPPADRWNVDDPVDFEPKRMYARTHIAFDQNWPFGEIPVQMGTDRVIGQKLAYFDAPDMQNEAGVMAHEIGHALHLPDLYYLEGLRDDVAYVDPWAMMGGGNGKFHHFCGWAKWSQGWIVEDPDPNINRTILVDLPNANGVSTTEAWLVPVEYWDDVIRDDVRDEVDGTLPIGQLMKLSLGSDSEIFSFLELRAKGYQFSQNLNPEPTLIATNGLDPHTDRDWAVNGLFRRSVHLLNKGDELQAVNDTWDFASAPEFPIKGCKATVVDIRTIRGSIPVYRVRVERQQAEYIDLHFQDPMPSYMSPDIWVDWAADNNDPDVPRMYPVGTPTHQGEVVRFPDSGKEKHYVVARVHNGGNVAAKEVKVRWYMCDPPGAGDDGRWVNRGTQIIPEIGPGDWEFTPFTWNVDADTNEHQCMRMEVIDWTIPAGMDPDTGDTVALASDDVKLQNNIAQQNVFNFEAVTGSPYAPIEFPMQVHNDRPGTEIAALVPQGLPYGSKLTISPREWSIPSGQARVFNCTLQLDENVIRPGCDSDSGFLLTAWRRGGEADANWGSCFYHLRPRFKTGTELVKGFTYWSYSNVNILGKVEVLTEQPLDLSDDLPLVVRVRLQVDGPEGDVFWHHVPVQDDGSFHVQTQVEDGHTMTIQAWFDRNGRLGSSVSNLLEIKKTIIG